MYKSFQEFFPRDVNGSGSWASSLDEYERFDGLRELFELFGGASFHNGLYRILLVKDVMPWARRISEAFPDFTNRALPFGYDWLGRFFCIDLAPTESSAPNVLLFSNFSNEVLAIPTGLEEFHNTVLVEQREAALEVSIFAQFLAASHLSFLNMSQCAEIIVPLYLGGAYTIENMKISDVTTYWEISTQLLTQLREVNNGTQIDKVILRKGS